MVGGLALAIVQIVAKRLRNAALMRRGESPYKDVVFAGRPYAVFFGGVGLLAGGAAAAVASGAWWPAAAVAGGVLPAVLAVVVVVAMAAQARG